MGAMITIEGITFSAKESIKRTAKIAEKVIAKGDFLDDKQWFLEAAFPGLRRCKRDVFKIDQEIFKGKSRFQDIHIF